jgi:hypothetical protein
LEAEHAETLSAVSAERQQQLKAEAAATRQQRAERIAAEKEILDRGRMLYLLSTAAEDPYPKRPDQHDVAKAAIARVERLGRAELSAALGALERWGNQPHIWEKHIYGWGDPEIPTYGHGLANIVLALPIEGRDGEGGDDREEATGEKDEGSGEEAAGRGGGSGQEEEEDDVAAFSSSDDDGCQLQWERAREGRDDS